jgi:hypothetical protein
VTNLFDDVPVHADHEIFAEILSRRDIRIERIVSTGQSTPTDKPHRQGHDEWVVLLAADLVRAFAQSAEKPVPAPIRDVSVDSRLAELERQIWRNRARVTRPF